MQTLRLSIVYANADALRFHLAQYRRQRALLLAIDGVPPHAAQYSDVALLFEVSDSGVCCELGAQILQVMAGLGLVVELRDTAAADALAGDGPAPESAESPQVTWTDDGDVSVPAGAAADAEAEANADDREGGGEDEEGASDEPLQGSSIAMPPGSGPLSWPIEKLQAEFGDLTMAEKVRVAKYGRRPARALVLRGQDRTLHMFLLENSRITPEEVTTLAANAAADTAMLRRIIASPEWLRHTAVARALICNPKVTLPQVIKLLPHLPEDELRRLARGGNVRAAIKREIMRRIERLR